MKAQAPGLPVGSLSAVDLSGRAKAADPAVTANGTERWP